MGVAEKKLDVFMDKIRKRGLQDGRISIIVNMIKEKMDISVIARMTNLSEEEIKKLRRDEYVNAEHSQGLTLLMLAAGLRAGNFVKDLISWGAEVNARTKNGETALMYGSSFADIIQILVSAGAEVNAKGKQGITPLMYAVQFGSLSAVKKLISLGAKVNVKDKKGKTALDWATKKKHKDIVKFLRSAGAN